jgi:parallel beta-helix repeat protein
VLRQSHAFYRRTSPCAFVSPLLPALLLGLAAHLAGCGGGGGSSEDTRAAPQAAPTNPNAPYLRLVAVDGNTGSDSTGTGSASAPYKTIGAAMRALQPGDDVVVAAGTYREGIEVPALAWGTAPTRIRAAVARSVTVKGSVEVSGWAQQSNGVYAVSWAGDEPMQVFRAGQGLQQVAGTVFSGYPTRAGHELLAVSAAEGEVWPGRRAGSARDLPENSFFYDAATRQLLVRVSTPLAAGEVLEASQRTHVLRAEDATGVVVQGIDFAHANTSFTYRQGAVKVVGSKNTLRDLAVRDMDGACVQMAGSDSLLADSTLERCGQLGLLARGVRMSVLNNRVLHANTRGFSQWWEAGGMKLIGPGGLHNATIKDNTVAYATGDGIWIDWKNSSNLIEGNTTAYNSGFGIHYEASTGGTIRANTSYGNGLRGIYLLESSDSLVEGNAVFGNVAEGIAVVDGWRSATDPQLRPTGNRVLRNTVAWNDFQRNWVQLTLPGTTYASASDRNDYRADVLLPRMSLGFVSSTNPAYQRLSDWRVAAQVDAASTEQMLGMPQALRDAIAARRLLQRGELPAYLASPGVN